VNTLEIVLIGKDPLVDDLDSSWCAVADESAKKDGGV